MVISQVHGKLAEDYDCPLSLFDAAVSNYVLFLLLGCGCFCVSFDRWSFLNIKLCSGNRNSN
jgi:hypothetical protein